MNATQAAALLDEVDAFIASPENRAWEKEVVASWHTGPTGYDLHVAAQRERRKALGNAASARRHAAKLQRTPVWADLDAILAVYERARRLTAESGVAHHVDHVLPLQGRLVSGLHVHTNLQILTGAENCRKNNRYEP